MFHDRESYVGRGIPEELAKSTIYVRQLSATTIPIIQQAVDSYEATGGRLADAADFGVDPQRDSEELKTEGAIVCSCCSEY